MPDPLRTHPLDVAAYRADRARQLAWIEHVIARERETITPEGAILLDRVKRFLEHEAGVSCAKREGGQLPRAAVVRGAASV